MEHFSREHKCVYVFHQKSGIMGFTALLTGVRPSQCFLHVIHKSQVNTGKFQFLNFWVSGQKWVMMPFSLNELSFKEQSLDLMPLMQLQISYKVKSWCIPVSMFVLHLCILQLVFSWLLHRYSMQVKSSLHRLFQLELSNGSLSWFSPAAWLDAVGLVTRKWIWGMKCRLAANA